MGYARDCKGAEDDGDRTGRRKCDAGSRGDISRRVHRVCTSTEKVASQATRQARVSNSAAHIKDVGESAGQRAGDPYLPDGRERLFDDLGQRTINGRAD